MIYRAIFFTFISRRNKYAYFKNSLMKVSMIFRVYYDIIDINVLSLRFLACYIGFRLIGSIAFTHGASFPKVTTPPNARKITCASECRPTALNCTGFLALISLLFHKILKQFVGIATRILPLKISYNTPDTVSTFTAYKYACFDYFIVIFHFSPQRRMSIIEKYVSSAKPLKICIDIFIY